MCQATVDLYNALFFLHGKDKEHITIPNINGSEKKPIQSKDTIVVFTQHATDGSVAIYIDLFVEKPKDLIEVFNGNIELYGEFLLATDPDGKEIFNFQIPKVYKTISIWVDNIDFPSIVKILIIS